MSQQRTIKTIIDCENEFLKLRAHMALPNQVIPKLLKM